MLILGESDTGKELLIKAIHNFSYRKKVPFVAISCGALPENMLESEMFSYKKVPLPMLNPISPGSSIGPEEERFFSMKLVTCPKEAKDTQGAERE